MNWYTFFYITSYLYRVYYIIPYRVVFEITIQSSLQVLSILSALLRLAPGADFSLQSGVDFL